MWVILAMKLTDECMPVWRTERLIIFPAKVRIIVRTQVLQVQVPSLNKKYLRNEENHNNQKRLQSLGPQIIQAIKNFQSYFCELWVKSRQHCLNDLGTQG